MDVRPCWRHRGCWASFALANNIPTYLRVQLLLNAVCTDMQKLHIIHASSYAGAMGIVRQLTTSSGSMLAFALGMSAAAWEQVRGWISKEKSSKLLSSNRCSLADQARVETCRCEQEWQGRHSDHLTARFKEPGSNDSTQKENQPTLVLILSHSFDLSFAYLPSNIVGIRVLAVTLTGADCQPSKRSIH